MPERGKKDEMLKRNYWMSMIFVSLFGIGMLHAQSYCPGIVLSKTGAPTNLACEISDATGASAVASTSLKGLPATIATQLGQMPLSTAISGSGLTINRELGVVTASQDSLGTILTQRGETLGKNKFMVSFNYQHYGFGSIDGASLGNFTTVQAGTSSTIVAQSDIHLSLDQYTAAASYGLTNKLDLTVVVPFAHVNLSTRSAVNSYTTTYNSFTNSFYMPGTSNGIGDVALDVKANVIKGEHTAVAVGTELRFKSGDSANYLGTGAYGVKPFVVISHRGRFTPNVNLGYQWNGSSILNNNNNLPGAFTYSGGVDYRVNSKFTLVGEFLGQAIINGPRLLRASAPVTIITGTTAPKGSIIGSHDANFAMDNAGGGFKYSPTKHVFFSASALFKLDNAGLRATCIPLFGGSYKF
jgi:hypothetical protein